jgi:Cu-processing system permease protein
MKGVLTIAGMEIRIGLRNRWVVAATLLLAALSLSATLLGSAPAGAVGVDALSITIVSLASLSTFLLPLIALLLSYDAVVGEVEQGTMLLLLSYPVTRIGVLAGKFIGMSAIITVATVVGYGVAGLLAFSSAGEIAAGAWLSFALMLLSSALLGAVFVALGLLAGTLARQRGTAAGLAVGIWLLFVLLFDMTLLGVLVASEGEWLSPGLFNLLLLVNPTDVFRMINMSGVGGTGLVSGMAAVVAETGLSPALLWATLVGWSVLPLGGAMAIFRQRNM